MNTDFTIKEDSKRPSRNIYTLLHALSDWVTEASTLFIYDTAEPTEEELDKLKAMTRIMVRVANGLTTMRIYDDNRRLY